MAETEAAPLGPDTHATQTIADAIDLADALARCVALGVEQPLVRAPLSWSDRARLHGVFDPVPSTLEISVYAEQRRHDAALGFYLIAFDQGHEISHGEHRTLAAAVAAAETEFGVARTAWTPAS